MSPLVFVLVAGAGGLGAVARFGLDTAIRARTAGRTLPWGTIVVNLTGSLLLGAVVGFGMAGVFDADVGAIAGTGFLGGYTTFSAASFESVQLIRRRRYGAALANGLGVLIACTLVAGLGLWLGVLAGTALPG